MPTQLFDSAQFGAKFSPCRRYRYELWRIWADVRIPRMLMFLGMNPSVADEINNDRTVGKMCGYAKSWGYDGLYVANVFSWCETDSKKLPALIAAGVDIVGPENDAAILRLASDCELIVAGWGNPGMLNGRGDHVIKMMSAKGFRVHAFGVNANGSPKHPLYISGAAKPFIV